MATCDHGEVTEHSSSVCAICFETVKDARLLSCLHSFCKGCLDDLNMRTGHDHKITCPICRSTSRLPENGASGLPKDITQIVEEVCECNTCKDGGEEGIPEVSCTTCHFGLCKEHGIPHLLANPDHIIKPLAIKGSVKRSPAGSSDVRHCEEHDIPLRYYCEQCTKAVCGDCLAIGAHRKHEPVVRITDIGKDLKQRVRHQTDNFKNVRLPCVQKSISAVEDVSTKLSSRAENVRTQIRSAGKRVHDAVELVIQQKLVEVDDLEKVRLKELSSQHDELKRHADCLKSVVKFGEKGLEAEAGTEEVCDLLLAIVQRADELGKEQLAEDPVRHAHVDYEGVSEENLLVRACELAGAVLPFEACAAHSVIEGASKKTCLSCSKASFIIAAKDMNGRALTTGGDLIKVDCAGFPEGGGECPGVKVLDKENGTYEISCKPQDVGEYSFEVFINKAKLQERLLISCHGPLTFDVAECQQGSTVTADQLTATHTGTTRQWSSVLGSRGMKTGQHTWEVKVTRSQNMHIFLGVAVKPGLTATECSYNSTYSWYGYNGGKWIMGRSSPSMSKWQVNDVIQLELDCDAHTLSITNTRSREHDTITNLPAKELFAYFATYDKDDSLILGL